VKPRDIALALAAPVLWGVGFTFAKPALAQFSADADDGHDLRRHDRPAAGAPAPLAHALWAMLVIGACGGAVQSILIFSGLSHLPASTAVLVVQSQVPFAVLWAWLIGKEAAERGPARRHRDRHRRRCPDRGCAGGHERLFRRCSWSSWERWCGPRRRPLIRAFGRDDGPTMTGMIGLVSAPLPDRLSAVRERPARGAADGNPRQLGRARRGLPARLLVGLFGLVSGTRPVPCRFR